MKVVFTDEALHDLDQILQFIDENYPAISGAFQQRIRATAERLGR
jgi:hypothetical protein